VTTGKQWQRLADLVDIDIKKQQQQLGQVQQRLGHLTQQNTDLSQFHADLCQEIIQPGCDRTSSGMLRQRHFAQSLEGAMVQQQASILQFEQQLGAIRDQLLSLLRKQHGYQQLADEAKERQRIEQEAKETDEMDDLSQSQRNRLW